MAFDEYGYVCPYNEACRCQVADCDFCGWNPIVHEKRMEEICEKLGITLEKTEQRCIDAIDLAIKMGDKFEALVKRRNPPRTFYAEAMKCIAAAKTIEMKIVTCEKCQYVKYIPEQNVWKCRRKKGLFREVQPDEFCSRGEELDDGKHEKTDIC